ncbi:MAG: hypothetical protein V4602_08305 [Pseudomonadota bacterium]
MAIARALGADPLKLIATFLIGGKGRSSGLLRSKHEMRNLTSKSNIQTRRPKIAMKAGDFAWDKSNG